VAALNTEPLPGDVWQQRLHVSGRQVRVIEVDDPAVVGARVLVEPVGWGRRSRILMSSFMRQWVKVETR
jgi:hypothetical protein